MAFKYTEDQLNKMDKALLIELFLGLQDQMEELTKETHALNQKMQLLMEQVVLAKHHRFGRSTERMEDTTQISFMEIDASERAIRGFCIGRKSWQLIDTIRGAENSAIIYSIAETAKANDPVSYTHLDVYKRQGIKSIIYFPSDDTATVPVDHCSQIQKSVFDRDICNVNGPCLIWLIDDSVAE